MDKAFRIAVFGVAFALSWIPVFGNAEVDFPETQCESIVRSHGFLSRAQFQCGFDRYSQQMIESARQCSRELAPARQTELLRDGMALFDYNEKVRGNRPDLCRSVLEDFPTVVSNTPNKNDHPGQGRRGSGRPQEASRLIERWHRENSSCRGGSGDAPETLVACSARERIGHDLAKLNWCFGKRGQFGYQMEWHSCEARSMR